jgi:hypothetical protein
MCFHNDYDWTASVAITTEGPAATKCRCGECGVNIEPGEWRKSVFLREHEECQVCQDEWSDQYDEEAKHETCTHEYGEEDTYTICGDCCKVLKAIEAHEKAAGCPHHARQPMPYELWEEMNNHHDGPQYAREAIAMFPELENCPMLVSVLEYAEGK